MRISRKPYLRGLEAETVVLHTTDDKSFRGVLVAAHADVYVLRHAALLGSDANVDVDGELLVPVNRVAFWQRIVETGAP